MGELRKEIVEGHELKLQAYSDGYKWMLTRKGHIVGLISTITEKRYLLALCYSKDGYTLIEDFDTLDDAWEKTKEYIAYFRL